MPGQNIGRKYTEQNPIADIAMGFMKEEKRKQDLAESREYEEQQFQQRNPMAFMKSKIINDVNTRGYENVSPDTQKWFDKFMQKELGGAPQYQTPQETKVPEGFQIKGYDVQGRPSLERKQTEVGEGLTSQQQFEILDIAAKMGRGKVKTIERITPVVEQLYRQGLNRDEIEDQLRYGRQSEEFSGTIRDAAQQLTSNFSDKKAQATYDKLDDLVAKGNESKTKSFLQKMTYDALPAAQAKSLKGQERTLEFLSEIKDDLSEYEAKGGNTNIFTGTFEDISARLGTVKDPELRKIATKILKARQQYRRAMTGVAFSEGENREYDFIFPGINRTANFNRANLEALEEAFSGDVDFTYSRTMGEDAYRDLFKQEEQAAQPVDVQQLFSKYGLE